MILHFKTIIIIMPDFVPLFHPKSIMLDYLGNKFVYRIFTLMYVSLEKLKFIHYCFNIKVFSKQLNKICNGRETAETMSLRWRCVRVFPAEQVYRSGLQCTLFIRQGAGEGCGVRGEGLLAGPRVFSLQPPSAAVARDRECTSALSNHTRPSIRKNETTISR